MAWFRVGRIVPDERVEELAIRVEQALADWQEANRELMEEHTRGRPPGPMRRVK